MCIGPLINKLCFAFRVSNTTQARRRRLRTGCGLAASLFRHKTPYIRVPTTSLAYVDASVGAKNGCNFLGSKNRLGTYVPPVAALLDSSFFRTQPPREVC